MAAAERSVFDLGLGILDFGFVSKSKTGNPKSKVVLASGTGLEPVFSDSKPDVLPVRRPRKEIGEDGRTRTYNLLVRSELL